MGGCGGKDRVTVKYVTGTETDSALRLATAANALPVKLLDDHVASQFPP